MTLREFENLAASFRSYYWRIRAERSANQRRRWYRYAAKEKARLAGLGIPCEVIRLYGLSLRNPRSEERRQRFEQVFKDAEKWPVQLSLF